MTRQMRAELFPVGMLPFPFILDPHALVANVDHAFVALVGQDERITVDE